MPRILIFKQIFRKLHFNLTDHSKLSSHLRYFKANFDFHSDNFGDFVFAVLMNAVEDFHDLELNRRSNIWLLRTAWMNLISSARQL